MSEDALETRDLIAVILRLMPLAERKVVSMYYLEGYKCHEIGKRFGVGAGQISKLVREIIRECGYLVTQLDKKRKVFFKPLISRKSVLFNHTPYTKKKLLDRRKKTKEKQDMEEAWALENFQPEWKWKIENGYHVHYAIRRAYSELLRGAQCG